MLVSPRAHGSLGQPVMGPRSALFPPPSAPLHQLCLLPRDP